MKSGEWGVESEEYRVKSGRCRISPSCVLLIASCVRRIINANCASRVYIGVRGLLPVCVFGYGVGIGYKMSIQAFPN